MEKAPMQADVNVRGLSTRSVLGVTLVALHMTAIGCGSPSSDKANAVASPHANEVKPAVAPAADKPAALVEPEPESEAAELPRGVSAPKPDARDQAPEPEAAPDKPAPIAKKPVAAPAVAKPAAPIASANKPSAFTPPKASAQAKASAQPKPAPPAPPAPAQPIAPVAVAEVPPPQAPPPKASVIVPHTDHVRVEVPAGLQHWLDEDDRMRPWLGKAVNVADSCYAKVRADAPTASGVITFRVTMHENARPTGSVGSVPSAISGIVMCATRGLLGVKMPLFTGTEGESHTVRVRFDP